jgi:hypothetical protein
MVKMSSMLKNDFANLAGKLQNISVAKWFRLNAFIIYVKVINECVHHLAAERKHNLLHRIECIHFFFAFPELNSYVQFCLNTPNHYKLYLHVRTCFITDDVFENQY